MSTTPKHLFPTRQKSRILVISYELAQGIMSKENKSLEIIMLKFQVEISLICSGPRTDSLEQRRQILVGAMHTGLFKGSRRDVPGTVSMQFKNLCSFF